MDGRLETLGRIDAEVEGLNKLVETHHPKLHNGKPFVIVRNGERITIEMRPRDGREAVLVKIEAVDGEPKIGKIV